MLVLGQYTYVDMYLFLKDEEDLRHENTSNVLLGLQCYASHSASSHCLSTLSPPWKTYVFSNQVLLQTFNYLS